MDDLELKLKRALEPRDPPPGFEARLSARVQVAARERPISSSAPWWRTWFRYPVGRAALAGSLAALVLIGLWFLQVGRQQKLSAEQKRIQAEQAREQLLWALEITNLTLGRVGQIVVEESQRPPAGP